MIRSTMFETRLSFGKVFIIDVSLFKTINMTSQQEQAGNTCT